MLARSRGSGRVLLIALAGAGASATGWLTFAILAGDEILSPPGTQGGGRALPAALAASPASTAARLPAQDPPADRGAPRPETTPPAPETPQGLWRLVMDLAHDHVRNNALRAMHALHKRRQQAAPLLARALHSHDRQQRQLAAFLLREFTDNPSDRLLEVTVEGLHTDRIPYDPERCDGGGGGNLEPEVDNAIQGTLYLLDHTSRARRFLLAGLFSKDPQQRFLCAFLAGHGGIRDHIWRTCQILIPHLADNDRRGDALMSARALYGLGPQALRYIRHARHQADRQANQLLSLLELDLVSPPRNSAELAARRSMHDITALYADPVIELDVRHTRFPSWEGRRDQPPLPPR